MALPKINQPIFSMTLPSNGETINFRPFTVKEEKILLIAMETQDPADIARATEQIINNCVVGKVDLLKLPVFDYQLLFINIRARSVGNLIPLIIIDEDDGKEYRLELNLDDIKVTENKNQSNKLLLTDNIGVIMKYPTLADIIAAEKLTGDVDRLYYLFESQIEKVFDENEVYVFSEFSAEERKDFLEGIPSNKFREFEIYLENLPKFYHKLKYTNSLGTEKEIIYEDFTDFFQ